MNSTTEPERALFRVLVIDDNPDMREMIQTMLEGAGFRADVAPDGRSGVELQRRSPVDLVVTDIFMPDQDGIETITQLRTEFPSLKIIAVSGGGKASHSHGYLATASEIGANAVLSKPFGQDQLISAVRSLLPTSTEPR